MSIDEQARALLKEVTWRHGEGPAVLLVHGWQDDNSLWSPLISALAELGIASVAFDLPGHGFSEGDSCAPLVASSVLQQIATELGPIDAVVTHSFGGPVTGFALLNGFCPRRIVLIAPPRGRNKRWFDFAEEKGISAEVVHRAREIYAAEAGLHAAFDLAEVASPIETLVIHSMDDEAVEWENGEAIARRWPNAELVLRDEFGHRMVAQDRGVIARIVQFVG